MVMMAAITIIENETNMYRAATSSQRTSVSGRSTSTKNALGTARNPRIWPTFAAGSPCGESDSLSKN